LRDEIAQLDSQILYIERENKEASSAIRDDNTFAGDRMTKALIDQHTKGLQSGETIENMHERFYLNVDSARIPFLKNLKDPKVAIPLGKMLLSNLQVLYKMAESASDSFQSSAKAQLAMMSPNLVRKHDDYWTMAQARVETEEEEKKNA